MTKPLIGLPGRRRSGADIANVVEPLIKPSTASEKASGSSPAMSMVWSRPLVETAAAQNQRHTSKPS